MGESQLAYISLTIHLTKSRARRITVNQRAAARLLRNAFSFSNVWILLSPKFQSSKKDIDRHAALIKP